MKLDRETVSSLSRGERMALLKWLRWWDSWQSACFAKVMTGPLEYSLSSVVEVFERAAFAYEAEARIEAARSGGYAWNLESPFAALTLGEADSQVERLGAIGWVVRSGRKPERGNWSRPFCVNLDASADDIRGAIARHLKRERQRMGLPDQGGTRRKSIGWDGLAAFDKRFLGFTLSDAEDKAARRALSDFRAGRF